MTKPRIGFLGTGWIGRHRMNAIAESGAAEVAAIVDASHECAVFCQKPLGRNAHEASRVVEAAQRANRLLGADFSYRLTAAAATLADLMRSGELGTIFAADLVFHNAYGPDKPWFYDRSRSGGGCVMDLGVHLADLALWLTDFPHVGNVSSRLFARGKPLARGGQGVEDYAVASFDLATDLRVNMACS